MCVRNDSNKSCTVCWGRDWNTKITGTETLSNLYWMTFIVRFNATVVYYRKPNVINYGHWYYVLGNKIYY